MTKEIDVIVDTHGDSRHLLEEEYPEAVAGFGRPESIYRNSHVDSFGSLSEDARLWLFRKGLGNLMRFTCTEVTPDIIKRIKVCFFADMLPVGGPVLGPFKKHSEAIAAEIQWLKDNNLPLPVVGD